MSHDAIVALRWPPWLDAEAELEALGDRFAEKAFLFCQKVVAGIVDHWTLNPFETHRGIPVYKFHYGKRYLLLAVEDVGDGDRKVSMILAGLTGGPVAIDDHLWDGTDMNVLRDPILRQRLEAYFACQAKLESIQRPRAVSPRSPGQPVVPNCSGRPTG